MTAAAGPRRGATVRLLRHEMRVAWREARFFGARGRSRLRPLLIALALQAAFLPVGWLIARLPAAEPEELVVFTSVLLLFAFAGMLAQTLVSATRVLYLRGDLDLLLSAPVAPGAVLSMRAVAVALSAITSWSLLAMLVINALVAFGQVRWLLLYPVLAGLALVAAAFSLALNAALFEILGPRRTRVAAQIVAACLGIGIVLLMQLPGWLGTGRHAGGGTVLPALLRSAQAGGAMWWPARAALGEIGPLVSWVAASVGLFVLTVAALGPRFARQAARAGSGAIPAGRSRRASRFRAGANAALRRKELRLLRRDPWLVSQVILPAIYLLPLAFLSWRGGAGSPMGMAGLAFVLIMIAGSLAGSLAWIAIAGEDAPELLACAPIGPRQALRAKLGAVLLPVAVLILLPLAVLALRAPEHALPAALGCVGAMTTAALLQFWHPQAGKRREFGYRHRLSVLRGLFELIANVAWGGAAAMTPVLPALGAVLWVIAALQIPVLWLLRWRAARAAAPA